MFQEGVRESMNRLPILLQPILTWLTGKPLDESEKIYSVPKAVDIAMMPPPGGLLSFYVGSP